MKSLTALALFLGASLSSLLTVQAQATAHPPERLTYQGFLVDGNGVALGNDAPKNYDVIFRIYDDVTGGELKWAEQQTVTVDKGYFSVLLGEGASTGEPRPDLSTLFKGPTASDRFVGVTVKGLGAGGSNVDILPRLRLLSSPYAFLAEQATKLVRADNSTDLLTTTGNTLLFNGELDVLGGGTLEFGAGLPKEANAGKIGYGTFTPQTLDIVGAGTSGSTRKVKVHAEGGTIFTGGIDVNGRIALNGGILARGGTPGANGVNNNGYAFAGSGDPDSGMFSTADGTLQFFTDNAERIRITAGKVGIGTASPKELLHVNGDYYGRGHVWLHALEGDGNSGTAFIQARDTSLTSSIGLQLRTKEGSTLREAVRVTPAGNVGIGTTSPGRALHVAGSVAIDGNNPLEFGRGFSKEISAGQIGYGTHSGGSGGSLDIVGAGTTGSNRKVQIWAEGGLQLNGPISNQLTVNDGLSVNIPGNGLIFQVTANTARVYEQNNSSRNSRWFRTANGLHLRLGGGHAHGSDERTATYDGDSNWDFSSDRRLKKDIVDVEPLLERALQVQVRRYRWKDEDANGTHKLGVIAQELQPLFPEMVGDFKDPDTGESSLTVGYSDFGMIAVKAIQELKAQHDAELAGLKAELAVLKAQMAEVLRASNELRGPAGKSSQETAAVDR